MVQCLVLGSCPAHCSVLLHVVSQLVSVVIMYLVQHLCIVGTYDGKQVRRNTVVVIIVILSHLRLNDLL
jgi:hypothetical protein